MMILINFVYFGKLDKSCIFW